jgi:hypothetical protein
VGREENKRYSLAPQRICDMPTGAKGKSGRPQWWPEAIGMDSSLDRKSKSRRRL